MYSNSKHCGEAQKIMPNLVSALKVYATSIYCAFLQGKIATILWKVELRLRKPKETPSLNRVLMFTWSKFFRKNYDNCDWHCDNCGWSDYDNCGWHCNNCGFFCDNCGWRCDNCGWWLIVTIVITSSSSNIQNISIKIDSIKIYSLVLFIIYLRYMTYINDSECRQQQLLDVMYLLVGDDIITCQAHISSFCMCIMSSGKHWKKSNKT